MRCGATVSRTRPGDRVDGAVGTGVAIAIGGVAGLALGILVSVVSDVPLAPEVGLLLGLGAGWLIGRER